MKRLFANLTEEMANAYKRVLSAGKIPFNIESTDRMFSIEVDPHHRGAACRHIARHLKNNDALRAKARASFRPALFNIGSVVLVSLVLIAVYGAMGTGETRLSLIGRFGADAGRIWAGSLYRCVTALLLHTGTLHLVSNIFGIVMFGTVVVYRCGWGVGWLMLLLAGAAANWMTAGWYQQAHVSIGSSTAVFAAVGLSAALLSRIFAKDEKISWHSWMPVAGAMALMGMMGMAPHTDVVAHFFGFLWGLIFGWVYNRWFGGWVYNRWFGPAGQPFQAICAILSAALVSACWLWGFWGL